MNTNDKSSRTDFIKQIVALPAAAAAIVAVSNTADAASKSSKASLKYQDAPKDGKQCSQCTLFLPNKTSPNKSACKIVAGDIKPSGYCIAYQKK